MWNGVKVCTLAGLLALSGTAPTLSEPAGTASEVPFPVITTSHLYLAAGDYRRALDTCHRQIDATPSAAACVRLTWVYQAIDAYLEHLSEEERGIAVEQLYLNLASRDTEDLVDPSGGLARMAEERIQTSERQQSDVSAAMAARLDRAQKTWWQGLPRHWRG
jgi:hypothetical protein